MEISLNECVEITPQEYMGLTNPVFIGQSSLDISKMYWMVFKVENVFYKIHNQLIGF